VQTPCCLPAARRGWPWFGKSQPSHSTSDSQRRGGSFPWVFLAAGAVLTGLLGCAGQTALQPSPQHRSRRDPIRRVPRFRQSRHPGRRRLLTAWAWSRTSATLTPLITQIFPRCSASSSRWAFITSATATIPAGVFSHRSGPPAAGGLRNQVRLRGSL